MRRRLGNVALLLSSVLVALLLGEAVLRLAGGALVLPQERFRFRWMVYDPVLAWRNVPGEWTRVYYAEGAPRTQRLRINDHGFRGPAVREPRPQGVTRIACLGDSVTFGLINNPRPGEDAPRMVPIASYPGELSRRLAREAPGRFEVLNAGVVGYSSSHGLRQLAVSLLALEPDVVTVRFGVNDSQPSWAPWHRSHEPESPLARGLLYRLHGWQLTRLWLASWRSLRLLHPAPDSVRWASDGRYRRNLERIVELARERGARVLLLDYPLAPPAADPALEAERRGQRRALARLEEIGRAVARERGVAFLETRAALRSGAAPAFDASDFIHPNPEGARRLAARIAEALTALPTPPE